MRIRHRLLAGLLCCSAAAAVDATTVWDEAGGGDFSNDGLTPTPVIVAPGSNVVLGTTGNPGSGVDRDYFRITVPSGAALNAIMLLGNSSVSGGASFIGIQPGPQLTVTPSGSGVENLIAFGHYGNDQVGTNILPAIRVGGTGPLPAGTYSVWVQETGGPASYGLDFVITPGPTATGGDAPLPAWAYGVLAVLLAGALVRQHSRA